MAMSKYTLLTKPTQLNKTKDVLNDSLKFLIDKQVKDYIIDTLSIEDDSHLIQIIVTNNSLPETVQWKIRTSQFYENSEYKLDYIDVDIVSSKSKIKSIDQYFKKILSAESLEDLPNILIICFNHKRVINDLTDLFKCFKSCRLHINEHYYKLKYRITLDEPDANLGVLKKFLNNCDKFADIILGILFVTATPSMAFWALLRTWGIKILENMKYDNIDNEEFKNYRSCIDHTFLEHNNSTKNPLEYIEDVYNNKLIDETKRVIVFAPAHNFKNKENVGSHEEVKKYFKKKMYCVLLLNGDFKGFIYPDNSHIEIDEFNKKYNVIGELRDTLVKWNEKNMNLNLAITGNNCIERGVTFNTVGFNFTHAIFSNYHGSKLEKLIQTIGRCSGLINYVDAMFIITTRYIWNKTEEYTKLMKRINDCNPKYFTRNDFIYTENTIPILAKVNDKELLETLVNLHGKKNYKTKFDELMKRGVELKQIILSNKNNIEFEIDKRELANVRMYVNGHDICSRRFKEFNAAFNEYRCVSQQMKTNEYCIDFVKDVYYNGDYVNERDIMWITFKKWM